MVGVSAIQRKRMRILIRGLLALSAFTAGSWIALAHPVMPLATTVFFLAWSFLVLRWPQAWLVGVPALLPLANFAPWTGWIIVEEFDIVLLGAISGGFGRSVIDILQGRVVDAPSSRQAGATLMLLLAVVGIVSLLIGLAHAGRIEPDWFAGYQDPLNGVRIFKSLIFALLLLPLVEDAVCRAPTRPAILFCAGMVGGLALASLAVLWERAAFVGVFDFQHYYRATALFWEMHVGGAALDAYLVLAIPSAWICMLAARHAIARSAAALTLLLAFYASFVTLSRGVFIALAFFSMIVICLTYRRGAMPVRAGMLVFAGAVMFAGPLFLPQRFAKTDQDMAQRLAHWRQVAGTLRDLPDWILGRGLGTFPAEYAASSGGAETPGAFRWVSDAGISPGAGQVRLAGPLTSEEMAGLFGITQRVKLKPAPYRVVVEVRTRTDTRLAISLCERHLIYEAACSEQVVRLPGNEGWQTRDLVLDASRLTGGPWYAPRLAFFKIAVDQAGKVADMRRISLIGPDGREQIVNGNFERDTARWFLTGRYYFQGWHTDSLYLDFLVERGLAGLLLFIAAVAMAIRSLAYTAGPFGRCMAASLAGAAVVGVFGSFMDVPRVAFLFWAQLVFAFVPGATDKRGDALATKC